MTLLIHSRGLTRARRTVVSRVGVRFGNYLSDLKWLMMSLRILPRKVENWREVLAYYLKPVHSSPLVVRLRNGDALGVP